MRKFTCFFFLLLLLLPGSADVFPITDFTKSDEQRVRSAVRDELLKVPEAERVEKAREMLRQTVEDRRNYDKISKENPDRYHGKYLQYREKILREFVSSEDPETLYRSAVMGGGILLAAGFLLGLKRFLANSRS